MVQREMENSGEEGNGSDSDNKDSSKANSEEEIEDDVPAIPLYTMTSGCSAALTGNVPINCFSLFVDECLLLYIVDRTVLNSKQFNGIQYIGVNILESQGGNVPSLS